MSIQGEYWIDNNGHVQYADGDIGDQNHEGLAIHHVANEFISNIISLAEELEVKHNLDEYETNPDEIAELLHELEAHTTREYIQNYIKANNAAYEILKGKGDAVGYCIKYEGWMAVRSMNIQLYGFDNQKRHALFNGLQEILEQEGVEEGNDDQLEFAMHDLKSMRSSYITLQDLENQTPRPQNDLATTFSKNNGDYRFTRPPDTQENLPQVQRTKPTTFTTAAQKAKIIGPGQELWRGTSENNLSFQAFLKKKMI